MSLYAEIPGWREAVERENNVREQAFLDAPEFICGIEVRPFSIRHFTLLTAIRSPFLCSSPVRAEDIALFFWVVSPEYKQAIVLHDRLFPWSKRLAGAVLWVLRYRFVRSLRGISPIDATRGIMDYVNEALLDAPRGSQDDAEEPGYWSAQAGIVGLLCAELGFSEAEAMSLPTKRAFQYLKFARKRLNPETHLFNPLSGDVLAKWLESLNRKK